MSHTPKEILIDVLLQKLLSHESNKVVDLIRQEIKEKMVKIQNTILCSCTSDEEVVKLKNDYNKLERLLLKDLLEVDFDEYFSLGLRVYAFRVEQLLN